MANQLYELVQDIRTYLNAPTIEAHHVGQIFSTCVTTFHCIADIMNNDLTTLPSDYPELMKDAMTAMNTLLFDKFSDINIDTSIAEDIAIIDKPFIDALASIVSAVNKYNQMMKDTNLYFEGQDEYNKSLIRFQRNINKIKRKL